MHPVRLDISPLAPDDVLAAGPAAGQALKRVKEQLRIAPDAGIGFGMLRYLDPEAGPVLASLQRPQISFNYLGRFATGATGDWQGLPDGFYAGAKAGTALPYQLSVNGYTEDGPEGPVLTRLWSWPAGIVDRVSVAAISESWRLCMQALITCAGSADAGGLTPSDLPLVTLSQQEIEALEADWRATQ
jgi:non-ribosomal peptide synthase protein (TIGR01720 family)